ncbi:hypothetical protein N1851_018850 [Merluccius polli]|uniref:Chemokine interleukin-8-like domain-containing protein n=1 Tax=Merluccius polli TaxID=89951 RepID=A0AA47NY01_MERPO|nr:hypothetical protein N1851_018850 [Merluccius polli]
MGPWTPGSPGRGAAGLGCSRLDPGAASSRRLPVAVAALPPRSSTGRHCRFRRAAVEVAVRYRSWWLQSGFGQPFRVPSWSEEPHIGRQCGSDSYHTPPKWLFWGPPTQDTGVQPHPARVYQSDSGQYFEVNSQCYSVLSLLRRGHGLISVRSALSAYGGAAAYQHSWKMVTCATVMKSLLVAAVVVVLSGQGSAVEKPADCCTQVGTQEITEPILDFYMQRKSGSCVNAIIFQTETGYYCSKIDAPWVRTKIQELRENHLPPGAHHLQLLSSINCTSLLHHGENHRNALNTTYPAAYQHSWKMVTCATVMKSLLVAAIVVVLSGQGSAETGFYCSKHDEPWVRRKIQALRAQKAQPASTTSLLELITSSSSPPSTAPPSSTMERTTGMRSTQHTVQ